MADAKAPDGKTAPVDTNTPKYGHVTNLSEQQAATAAEPAQSPETKTAQPAIAAGKKE